MKYKEIVQYERRLYFKNFKEKMIHFFSRSTHWYIWKYVKALRLEEKYMRLFDSSSLYAPLIIFARIKKNNIGRKLCFDIPGGVFEPGLLIWHSGSIAVNPNARVGKDAVIVGNLCIGNNGGKECAPEIGDNCVFGWDSTLIGDIKIGSNCKIGAKAFVNKSYEENNAILVGIPAKNIAGK